MPAIKTLSLPDRRKWRAWLRKNYKSSSGVWLVYYKKASGKPRIPYNDAVEEALCFGWIDSTVRTIDDERFAQRFSPRNPKTAYSPANQERLRKLIAAGKVAKSVLASLPLNPPPRFRVPKDILEAIKSDKAAYANYRKLSPAYKRIRIGFIEGARQPSRGVPQAPELLHQDDREEQTVRFRRDREVLLAPVGKPAT